MIEGNASAQVTRVRIPVDHPCFPGHFPGQPILPGVLLLERVLSMAQTVLQQPLNACTVQNVKFLTAVAPGDELELRITSGSPTDHKFTVHVLPVDGAGVLACSGQLRVA